MVYKGTKFGSESNAKQNLKRSIIIVALVSGANLSKTLLHPISNDPQHWHLVYGGVGPQALCQDFSSAIMDLEEWVAMEVQRILWVCLKD